MKRILVTGAGGFIGGRLVEVLKDRGEDVHVLLRTISKGARIASYPLSYFKGNVTDEQAVAQALKGCEAVVHCAHDFARPADNLKAAELIARQCRENGIKKLVYLSSFSVHKGDENQIDESSPVNSEWEYASNKYKVELALLRLYREQELPVVILRPTIVYGPFSAAWTISTVEQMLENRMVVPYAGERVCNAVYIDDVVSAILAALHSGDHTNGQAYLVSGPEAVRWKDYYNAYLVYPYLKEPVYLGLEESESLYRSLKNGAATEVKPNLAKDPISFLKKTPVYGLYQALLKHPVLQKRIIRAKSSIPRPLLYPSKEAFDTLSCQGTASIAKAAKELGFHPEISFSEGMKRTIRYIEWANLNCN